MATVSHIKENLGQVYGKTASVELDGLLGAVAQQLGILGKDIDHATAQLTVTSASEDWLDFWGDVLGPRRSSPTELDVEYGPRIIEETIRQRPQPHALVDIVQKTLGLTIIVRDLWPHIIQTNQWHTPAGRPPQVLNGHLEPGWISGSVMDMAVRLGFAPPYEEGSFGVWVDVQPDDPFLYTLENVQTLLPHILLLNELVPGATHVLNGHLTSPDLGGPSDTAKYLFTIQPETVPSSITDVLNLIEKHRAAGTEAVFMGFVI